MTHHSDIAGLSERLREMPSSLNDACRKMDEAATALDSLSARVKELEAERDKWSAQAMKEDDCRKMWQSRALRAEQQRDEAYERAAKVVDRAIAEFDDLLKREDVHSAPVAVECTRIVVKAFGELAAAIRRLASGQGGSVEMEGK